MPVEATCVQIWIACFDMMIIRGPGIHERGLECQTKILHQQHAASEEKVKDFFEKA